MLPDIGNVPQCADRNGLCRIVDMNFLEFLFHALR
jgi:hypothetical protein